MSQSIGVCVLVLRENQLLLGKRKNAYKAGYFGLPGGRIELHEKLEDCARRELLEETSLIAQDLEYVGVVKEAQGEYDFIHFVFLCTNWVGEPECREADKCEKWEWYSVDALPQSVLPGHLAGINMLKQRNYLIEI